MSDVEIKGRLSIDTGDSAAKVGEVKKAVGDAGKESAASGGMFNKLKGELGALDGPVKNATGGVFGLKGALDVLKAHPIIGVFVLIAGLVTALFGHFSKMEKVSDALGKAWATLSGIFEVFMEKILKPLIDGFVTLVEWIEKAATWITGLFSPATAAAAERLGELEEKMDDLNDVEAKNNLTRAESNRRLQEARDIAADANIPITERIKALEEAAKIERETLTETIKINEERARIVLEKIAIEMDARKELIDQIRQGSVAEVKAARDALFAMDNVNKEKIKKFDEYIIAADDNGAQLAKVEKKTGAQIKAIQNEDAREKERIAKEHADKLKQIAEKAAADRKAALANQREYEARLLKIQREIELGNMKDSQEKELTLLMNGYQDEMKANDLALEQKKVSIKQYWEYRALLFEQFNQREAAINQKYKDEADKKEKEEQKEKDKKAAEQLAAKNKQAADDFKIMQKLAIDKLNFQISQNNKDIRETRRLLDAKKAELSAQFAWEILTQKHTNAERLAIQQTYVENMAAISEAKKQIDIAEVNSKKEAMNQVSGMLDQAAELAGRHTVAGKALAIASTTIQTYQSAMAAYKGMVSAIPGPVGLALGVVAAALSVATGIANIRKIASTQIPGQGGGGSAPGISAPPAPVLPQRATTQLNAASIQGIGNAAAGGVNRAFVLDADIRNNGERDRRLNRAARLG